MNNKVTAFRALIQVNGKVAYIYHEVTTYAIWPPIKSDIVNYLDFPLVDSR